MVDLSKVILGTGSYDTIKSGNTVSITGDGGNAWNYYGPAYKKLAPRLITYEPYAEKFKILEEMKGDPSRLEEYKAFRRQIEDEYLKSFYETRLKDLDVEELLNTLYERFGTGIILLCHEPIEEFCHRRPVANYIGIKTGFEIPEVSTDAKGKVKKLVAIDYTDRLKELMK